MVLKITSLLDMGNNYLPSTNPRLKADQPHSRNYPHMPTDYRHTDNPLRLVIGFSQESAHRRTNGRMDGRYQVLYLPASRSIKIT